MKFNLKKTLLYSLIFGLLSISIGYIYIYNYYKKFVSESELNHIITEINNSDSVSLKFISIYKKVNNNDCSNSTNEFIFSLPINMINKNHSERCPCLDANYGLLVWNTLERISLGIQLDKKVGSKKCLDYYLSKIQFPGGIKGVNGASKNIYNKDIENLTEVEMIELALISENPFFYNKKRRPVIVKNRLEETLIKYNYKK